MTKDLTQRLIDMQKFGFWIRTKLPPYRAVRWEEKRYPDGRQSFRGRNWVEVLAHGSEAKPERFFAADVEPIGPNQRMFYYPAAHEPVCGWQEPAWRVAGEYCPRVRERDESGELEPFCRKHIHALREENDGADS